MQLYYCDTLSPQKACAVARHLGSPVEFVRVDLGKGEHRTPAFEAMNPNAKVPVLKDGEEVVTEANAIMCYLADKAGSPLWPRDTASQIQVIRWFTWDAAHFTRHAGQLYFEYVIKPRFGIPAAEQAALDEATQEFRRFAAILDNHLRGRNALVGEDLTVADFAVAVTLSHAERAKIPVSEFPEVTRWYGRLAALDAWQNPFPASAAGA